MVKRSEHKIVIHGTGCKKKKKKLERYLDSHVFICIVSHYIMSLYCKHGQSQKGRYLQQILQLP